MLRCVEPVSMNGNKLTGMEMEQPLPRIILRYFMTVVAVRVQELTILVFEHE